MSIGPFEILLVLAVLALIVGPRRVTNMAKSLGRGVQDFVLTLDKDKKERLPGEDHDEEPRDR